jgi:serine/threonine-protein kinase HipA
MNAPAASAPDYQVADELYVWCLTQPAQPRLVGQINTARVIRGASFRYHPTWLAQGFALSEDLPLQPGDFLPNEKDAAPGAIDDARPDRWGERLIRFIDKPPRLSLLEYLYFAGDDRFGALGVSTSAQAYEPRRTGPLPTLADTQAIQTLVQRVLANEPVPAHERHLISPGVTMGGARPKALIQIDGQPWVVKFSEGEPVDTPLVEHASMTLATQAGIHCAWTQPIKLLRGHAIAVRRFDRQGAQRVHALSAHVALRAAGERMGYPELAQLLRRRGSMQAGLAQQQMRELFRRMVFNILIDNTDDHEKNHVLLMDAQQQLQLSPAFDVLPSGQALGYQQMRVGVDESDATLDNALSMSALFALRPDEARAAVREVCLVVQSWQAHFASCGVSATDIALLSEQIDRPFLRDQRAAYGR